MSAACLASLPFSFKIALFICFFDIFHLETRKGEIHCQTQHILNHAGYDDLKPLCIQLETRIRVAFYEPDIEISVQNEIIPE